MPPTGPVDETAPDRTPDRAPVRLAQALPEVLDHLSRHRRTDTEPAHPRPSPAGGRTGHPHRRHRSSASSTPTR
ncbi:hypothetical protein [Nocardiopsis xinjiangensis]|uniref:hypothetical protein n=1 Tax=Nocardiopsis xinjiangensis TaxID=124285 RepID=UPI00034C0D64|nr:hypothetical protein [Nocardiopsis xinjiangensis]